MEVDIHSIQKIGFTRVMTCCAIIFSKINITNNLTAGNQFLYKDTFNLYQNKINFQMEINSYYTA